MRAVNESLDRLESLFAATLQKPPAERAAYMDQACENEPALRDRVEALLRAQAAAGSFLENPAAESATTGALQDAAETASSREAPGALIGPYKLIEQIGEGGMGTVWMAQQTEPVKRLVAVKLIKAGMDSRQVIARFEAERQALALMDHANIARVLEAGTTGAGRPYFVMDLVKGVPITRYCDDHHLTPRQRLELFIPVCQAVQHAHQKGIIHRDLKPSNVLVALYDGKPVPKVIDFGVAKAAGQQLTDKTLVTGFGAIVGTLEYMSPEQAEINQLDIDTRSDIYSLGVLLYELLTGSTPFSKKDLERAGMLEMLRVIREQEPTKPSTKLSTADGLPTLAANRGTEPAKLTKLVRGELDWIVMKALEKDRSRRYETANAFAIDVQRYLADEPVQACPPSAKYRLRKFLRRNKSGLAVAALVMFFLVLLGSGVGWAVRDRAAREAEAARQQADRRTKVAGQVETIFADVDRLEGEQQWPEALAAARRAEAVVAGGEADPATAERVGKRLMDLEFIERLGEIRMQRATWAEGETFDFAREDREYAQAFRNYGVNVEELAVETSIDWLKARPALALPLAAALDDWVTARLVVSRLEPKVDAGEWKRLVAVARGIDPDPLRDRVRATWGRPDSEVRAEKRRLAESIDIRAHHPATLHLLARPKGVVHSDFALRLLREAQPVYPGDFWLNFELGHALNEQKHREEAIRFYTVAVALRPNSAAARNNLGNVFLDQKNVTEAIAYYRKAIELDPKMAAAHNNLGNAFHRQKNLAESIAHYKKAIEFGPTIAVYQLNLGAVLCDDLKDYGKAVACFRKAIEIDLNYADAYCGLGNALSAQNKLDEAMRHYRKAIELDPKHFGAYTNLGVALRRQNKWDEAIALHKKFIELDPNFAEGHNKLGKALREQGKLDEAIGAYRTAIALDPKLADAHFGLGIALRGQKKLPEAIDAYRKAITLEPANARAHCNLGSLLGDQKKWDDAIASYHTAIELDQKCFLAHTGLGDVLVAQNKRAAAALSYRRALEINPADAAAHCILNAAEMDGIYASVHCDLGFALRSLEKWPEAINAYRRAIELDPKCEPAWQYLGWVQYRIENWRASIETLEKSCKIQQGGLGDAGQWIVLALAHARLAAQEALPQKERAHHRAEGRRRYEQADKQIDSWWRVRPGDEIGQAIWDFRAEARELMGTNDSKK
jgi:eukaryotic-like serine/threonine-protein kinase